jgi:hypothetical protein
VMTRTCRLKHSDDEEPVVNSNAYTREYLVSRDTYDEIEARVDDLNDEHRKIKKEIDRMRTKQERWKGMEKNEILEGIATMPDVVRRETQDFMFSTIWDSIDDELSQLVDSNEISKKNFFRHREYIRAKHILNMFHAKDRKKYFKILDEFLPHYNLCHLYVMQYINNVEWEREQWNISRVAMCTHRLASNMMASTSGQKLCEHCTREISIEIGDIQNVYERTSKMEVVQRLEKNEHHDTSDLFRANHTLRNKLLEL